MKSITLDEAKEILNKYHVKTECETIDVDYSMGRITAEDVKAMINNPPFRRSAMDGYALRRCDYTEGRSMKVFTEIDAGDTRDIALEAGNCVRIMTGARVPDEADCVVPQELTDYGEDEVNIHELPKRDNISPVGEDYFVGDILVPAGYRINSSVIACLKSAAVQRVKVYKPVRVAILNTGDELIASGEKMIPGKIYDSNGVYLSYRLRECGYEVTYCKLVSDNLELLVSELKEALKNSDYIITTGGVSVGKKDYLEEAMNEIGAEIIFHGISVKPGMPTMFAVKDNTPILSLSGNHYSAMAVFEYIFPGLKSLDTVAVLKEDYKASRKPMRIVRGILSEGEVTLMTNQKNASTKAGTTANCLVKLPEGDNCLNCGTRVSIKIIV